MDFFYYFSRNQHIRNYKKRYSDFKEENHCRPVLPNKFYTAYNNLPALASMDFFSMDGFRGFSVSNDLSNHYYIAKSQAAFLTKLKNELISRVN